MTSKNYTANILGEDQEVCDWDENGDLLLADGSRCKFEWLDDGKPTAVCASLKLCRVSSLRFLKGIWKIDGVPLEDWINLGLCSRICG